MPWRLAEGKTLYLDVATFNAPLSSYFNALAFKLFGPGLDALVAVNLALLAVVVALFYRLASRLGGSATLSCALFLGALGFSRLGPMGNFNFVTPYSHEATHGLLLSLCAVASFSAYLESGRRRALVAAGFFLGCLFLTKIEFLFAAGASGAAALGLRKVAGGGRRASMPREAGLLLAGLAVPPALALACLSSRLGAAAALRGILGPFFYAADPGLLSSSYSLWGEGFDRPWQNLLRSIAAFLTLAGALAGFAAADLALGRRRRERAPEAVAAALAAAGLAACLAQRPMLAHFWARGLPFVDLAAVLFWAGRAFRERAGGRSGPAFAAFLFSSFSLLLLSRTILNARVYHYGFVLSAPSVVLVGLSVSDWVPAFLRERGGTGRLFRAAALSCLAVWVLSNVWITRRIEARETFRLGAGRDVLYGDERAGRAADALALVEARIGRDETFAVFPEGIMLNYLSRRPSPVPYSAYLPDTLEFFGEAAMLESLRRRPPDWVVLTAEDTSLFGAGQFGTGYGRSIYEWLLRSYEPVAATGFASLLKRKPT